MDHAVLVDDGVAVGREGAAQGLIAVKLAVLLEVGDAQHVGALDGAGFRLDLAGQQPQQCGFAAAVRSHQADAHACGKVEIQVVEERALADGVAQVFELDEALGLAAGRGEVQPGA